MTGFLQQAVFPILVYFAHVSLAANQTKYVILFDAGSSGTRMKIYQFLASGPSLQFSDVNQFYPSPHEEEPGIADLSKDPSQVEAYMMPLLESAKKTIPQDKHTATPIFLLATAGMRLLPEDQQNAILDEVRTLFNNKTKCPFLFEDDNDARIISGESEGIYAWVTVNFLSGVFGSNKTSYGSLDLGGASHQTSFALSKKNPHVVVINVSGRNFSIFARSFLGYGLDKVREKYLSSIVQKAECAGNPDCIVKSPCHNEGFEAPLKYDDQERVFEGTAQVGLCRQIIRELFFCRNPADLQQCPFSDQPKLRGKFYAMSGIYYVLSGIGAVCGDCENNLVAPTKISRVSRKFCGRDYSEINDNPFAKNNCFGSNYIYELLTAGYKLPPKKKIAVTGSLRGFDLGWSLGAVLLNTEIANE